MTIDRKTQKEIKKSIQQYQDLILNDINLNVRLVHEEDKTYTSELTKWEKDGIVFAAPIEQCDWVILPLPLDLEIRFITRQTVFAAVIRVISRQQVDGKLLYKGELISPLTKKQQRAHFRLATLFQISYRILPEHAQIETPLETLPVQDGTAVNISVGGMCMVCKRQLKMAQCIDITFNFLEHEFDIRGKVLDIGDKNENGTYTHRITFMDLDSGKENLLSKLIFEKQRLLMQSARQPLYKK